MKAPWFPFYCGDFLASSDVQLMEAHEVGAYVLLLTHSWQSNTPGYLPNDEGRLRRLARLSAEAWKDCGALLLSKWPVAEDDTMRYNPRLKKEAEKQVELRELKAEAGRKSAERRAKLATGGQQSANTNPTPVEIPATGVGENGNYSQPQSQPQSQEGKPSSSSFQSEEAAAQKEEDVADIVVGDISPESPTPGLRTPGGAADVATRKDKRRKGAEPAGFECFWQAYPRKEKRPAAAAAFGRLQAEEQAAAILGVKAWFARRTDWVGPKGDFRPHPTTWLNEKRWLELANPTPHLSNPQQNAVYSNQSSATSAAARLHTPAPDASAGWGYPGS